MFEPSSVLSNLAMGEIRKLIFCDWPTGGPGPRVSVLRQNLLITTAPQWALRGLLPQWEFCRVGVGHVLIPTTEPPCLQKPAESTLLPKNAAQSSAYSPTRAPRETSLLAWAACGGVQLQPRNCPLSFGHP